jgi:hypothetical protein
MITIHRLTPKCLRPSHGWSTTIGPNRRCYTRPVERRGPELLSVSLEPSPVIEAYKKDVDRTLLRENLTLTPDQRVRKMIAVLRFTEAVRQSRPKPEPK